MCRRPRHFIALVRDVELVHGPEHSKANGTKVVAADPTTTNGRSHIELQVFSSLHCRRCEKAGGDVMTNRVGEEKS
jgi:hypothetical protein